MDRLFCLESPLDDCYSKAHTDLSLLDSKRVLLNLLQTEDKYIISSSYFKYVQTHIKPHMRHTVASWMLEVCDEHHCAEGVFSMAMNYLDRFLSIVEIRRDHFQLLGAVCIFLASKMKDPKPITAERLCRYADYSFTVHDVTSWELLVVTKLKWDLWAITPHDFLDYIMRRLPDVGDPRMIERHARTFMTLCATDFHFSMHSASIIAAASVGVAVRGLANSEGNQWTSVNEFLTRLHEITNIETDVLRSVLEQIETMVTASLKQANQDDKAGGMTTSCGASAPSADKLTSDTQSIDMRVSPDSQHSQAETPTDVRDVML